MIVIGNEEFGFNGNEVLDQEDDFSRRRRRRRRKRLKRRNRKRIKRGARRVLKGKVFKHIRPSKRTSKPKARVMKSVAKKVTPSTLKHTTIKSNPIKAKVVKKTQQAVSDAKVQAKEMIKEVKEDVKTAVILERENKIDNQPTPKKAGIGIGKIIIPLLLLGGIFWGISNKKK